MISVGEALATVVGVTPVLPAERATILDALGRVAAEAVVSERAVPAAPYSAMDGYALRHADASAAGAELRIVDVEPAGTVVATRVEPGTAVKLFTGSVIPPGADAVVRIEDCEERDGRVRVGVPVAHGANVRDAGEDVRPGDVVVEVGAVIGPADVGVLASVGRASVLVHQRPRVAIVSTGSELVEVERAPGPGQVVNSNAWALAAAVREGGGVPTILAIAADRPDVIRTRLAEAARADVVLSTGGVSVGDLDFVKDALAAVRVEQLFWRVAQKPGKPLAFGRLGETLFFGLPGNPVSALVCFAVYVRPALRRMQGHARIHLPVVGARLAERLRKSATLTEFVRVRLADDADGLVAHVAGSQSSGVLTALGRGAGLLVAPAGPAELAAGTSHPVIVPSDATLARDVPPV